ncbi:hypothetical protein C882_0969 [Caenispirillum salinarum AK4]|uniref:Uncharacterized protein n=1 Tax=Caenispirillum salinarum AK4 TaxID=1238182 RepID=K9GQY4_9PROT|nr:hypothetical protein [Caenispirillum salinarum]EKV28395.1 hypothetical protein C882_0969 [Caenispirillum salinarum AK4]
MLSTESGHRAVSRGGLYRVCWKSSVTQIHGRSAPMSRDQAEFLAHDEAIGTASCRFWIEPLGETDDDLTGPPPGDAARTRRRRDAEPRTGG